jgi:G3E family GTPase
MTLMTSTRCLMDAYAALESIHNINYLFRGDMINTLDTLLSKRHLDYVLIEMNGLADPSAIIQTFWVDEGLGSLVRLHQTVALVDCKSFPLKLTNHHLVETSEDT